MATNTVANPSDVAGAAACLALLQQINRLPTVQVPIREDLGNVEDGPDDGKRMDYTAADQLLGKALDLHGANRGFRQSLANFLLGELQNGTTNLTQYDAQYLLNDGGYRPKDTRADGPVPSRAGTPEERRELAASASYEIESIALTLQTLEDSTDNAFLMRGLFLRIEALNGVVMSVTSGGDEGRALAEMREVLFGPRRRDQVEAAHD